MENQLQSYTGCWGSGLLGFIRAILVSGSGPRAANADPVPPAATAGQAHPGFKIRLFSYFIFIWFSSKLNSDQKSYTI